MTTSAFQPTSHDTGSVRNDRRARRFARVWRFIDAAADEQIRSAKAALLTDLPRQIVEVGPGRGANFAYFAKGTRVIALEPNPYFHDHLRSAAAARGIDLDLRAADVRASGLDDASQDLVVSTLVLCSVGDLDASLSEIHRILRPGGRLLFIEHVAAAPGTLQARYQRIVRRPWQALGDGCDPCAATVAALERSALTITDAHLERRGSNLDPTNLIYWGAAQRA
jgi:SAM-dependent methyltransferase